MASAAIREPGRRYHGIDGTMHTYGAGDESLLTLRADLFSARVLVWVASVGRDGELTDEAHAYFYDRYSRLAACYRRRGRERAATRAQSNADRYGTEDGPPFAAALAMPKPRLWIRTWAVSGRRDPDDVA